MTGKRKPLTAPQALALAEVRKANAEVRRVKRHGEAELRRQLAERMAVAEVTEALMVKRALELGVSKRHIYMEGLLTTNPGATNTVLARLDGTLLPDGEEPLAYFTWSGKKREAVRVNYPSFATTSKSEEYPTVLRGLVAFDDERGAWRVLEDESDILTEFGTLTGMLHWEIEEVDPATPGSLASLLNEWKAENQ